MRHLLARYFNRLGINHQVKDSLLRSIPIWVASLVTGIVAVAYAKLFAEAEHAGMRLVVHSPLMVFIVAPATFVGGWYLVNRFAPLARGSGIPQVSAALDIAGTAYDRGIDKLLSLRVILVKIASSTLLAFGGGAIGREGPTIQISASVFYLVNSMKPYSWPSYSERVVVLTGSAAGLAAAFNTPLGGIVFAIEELSRLHFNSFRTTLLAAVIVAGFTAQSLLGPYLFLGYPRVGGAGFVLVAGVIAVALVAGIAGAFFSRMLFAAVQAVRQVRETRNQLLIALMLGLTLACLAHLYSMKALGSGKETMVSILFGTGAEIENSTVIARLVGPMLSFVAGAAGGIFAPALSAGATIGAFLAPHFTATPEQVNILVLAGMVGFLTAITRSPFTAAVLVLEMTDRHSVIFFLMLAGLASYAAARLIGQHSLYEQLKPIYIHSTIGNTSYGRGK